MKQHLLPETGTFYKTNLHSHTICSDGKQTPEEVKKVFMEKGYSAVAYTDHEIMLDHSDLTDENFVALTAYEYGFDKSGDNALSALYDGELISRNHVEKVHLNLISKDPHDTRMVCYNVDHLWGNAKQFHEIARYIGTPDYQYNCTADGVNEVIRAAKERDMIVVYNHPGWSMNTLRLYGDLEGVDAFEMINGDTDRDSDMDYAPHVYQELARVGKRMICVAGDDNHNNRASGLAWTMIKAPSLSYDNLIKGLENGDCYVSDGPAITELYVEHSHVTVRTSEAESIFYYSAGRRTHSVHSDDIEGPLTEATFRIDPTDLMFRIAVRDSRGHHACTRFYYFDELKEPVLEKQSIK